MTIPCTEFVCFQCKKLNTTTYNSGLVMSDSAARNVGAGLVSWTHHFTSRCTLTTPLDERASNRVSISRASKLEQNYLSQSMCMNCYCILPSTLVCMYTHT